MKRKLLTLFLLLTLIFAVGCNKQEKTSDPTPVPTSTPTPTPINLAKENLSTLIDGYDSFAEQQSNHQIDFNKGVGYDMTMDISLGTQIKELLEITNLETLRLSGTVDMKEAISANLGLYFDSTEVIRALLFMDQNNIMFNLPKYSSNFAAISMEELLADADISDTQNFTNSMTLANAVQLSNELTDLFRTHLTNLVKCFKEADCITENSSIGTGDYVMTGDKHTVQAKPQDIITVLKALEADLEKYYGELDFDLSSLENSTATAVFLDYYIDENGNYAWAFHNDITPADQIVFINTKLGFCLYNTKNGVTTLGMTSEKLTENSGTIYLYFSEEALAEGEIAEPLGTIDYEYDGKALHAEIILDTEETIIETTIDFSMDNDVINCDITLVVDGMSFIIKEKATKEHVDMTFTLASYGIEYATVNMDMTLRDYVANNAPANAVDAETWAAKIDQQTMITDLFHLITEYPFLASLFELME